MAGNQTSQDGSGSAGPGGPLPPPPTRPGRPFARGPEVEANPPPEQERPEHVPPEVDEFPDRPPRGDVVEIPGEPVAVEYEEVRSAPPWLTPLAISIVALIAVFVVARAAIDSQVEPIELSQVPTGSIPTALADGSALPDVPSEITDRFAAQVVGTAEVANPPEELTQRCAQPFSAEQLDAAALERINEVVSDGRVADLRIGPEVLSVLRTGAADSPPEWPQAWLLSCLARLEDGQWTARPPRLDFARNGDRGAADAEPGVAGRIAEVPSGATWAVHERDGWWMAAPVTSPGWVQLVVNLERARAPVRVVFLNDDGEVISDSRLTIPEAPGTSAEDGESGGNQGPSTARTLDVGTVDEILSAVQEGPVRGCADDLDVCVWITRIGSELQAHAAHGPHHLDVPPFGELGWCPEAGRFQGTVTRSQFLPDGSWRTGVAPRGADAFPLRFSSGRVLVDLGDRMPGDPATDTPRPSTLCVFTGDPIGAAAEDQEAIEPL